MELHECIAFLLIQDHHVLAEKRKRTKKVMPGAIALPGGHIEVGESPEAAVYRELSETLDLDVDRVAIHEYRRVYDSEGELRVEGDSLPLPMGQQEQ
jgi:8-oxo-dGTP pyrophosphatase MutT (NUDIX family)